MIMTAGDLLQRTRYATAFGCTDDWRIMGYLTKLIQLQKLALHKGMKRGNNKEQ
jgi:hypothetical protein